jgi:hypothetical protein
VPNLLTVIKELLTNIVAFSQHASGITLRTYQVGIACAVVDSIINKRGLSIVVMLPRQSGKNELQAQLQTYLLTLFSHLHGEMVMISPTWKPQSLNAMRRLERNLKRNLITRDRWKRRDGYVYNIDTANCYFLSGSPEANIVGATASILLDIDEAQDILPSKFDKEISPMGASTNVTTLFCGTAWTSQTLLARELRAAADAQEKDGQQRVFRITADQVSAEVQAYGDYVAKQIAKLGRNHPLIKTQYYCEEIDAEAGMFPPARRILMQGNHEYQELPLQMEHLGRAQVNSTCGVGPVAFLIDVAGIDESKRSVGVDPSVDPSLENPARDSTTLTIVLIDFSTCDDPLVGAPTYRVVHRHAWQGDRHTLLYQQFRAYAEAWQPAYWIIDSTGVGAGLADFVSNIQIGTVIPFTFTSSSKSKLGWDFLGIIETGRFKNCQVGADGIRPPYQDEWQEQLEACQMTVLPGPGQLIKWGVPDGTRSTRRVDPLGRPEPLHDDWILSAALVAVLDQQELTTHEPALIVHAQDPLEAIDKEGF